MNDSYLPLGFVGTGRMATALAAALVQARVLLPGRLFGFDPVPEAVSRFTRESGGRPLESNRQLVRTCRTLVLAVKPQQVEIVAAELAPELSPQHLVVSILAGVPLERLRELLGPEPRLVRVMPNTPCLLRQGASAFCVEPGCSEQDVAWVRRLLEPTGYCAQVPERLMDAVTGLSGSGPAYVFVIIEALSDAGVRMGLPRELATQLAAHTVAGAAQMVIQTDLHPAQLKDQVTSPGGTTIAGLQQLESHGLRAALMAAVEAATWRSVELGQS